MAVLVEAISVVIRCDRLLAAFDQDWESFKALVPNKTLCADNELVRVGFMAPADAKQFVHDLAERGLTYLADGKALDLVVVDQQRGPMARCDWIEFGHVNLDRDPKERVAACQLSGGTQKVVVTPEGWKFEDSLSASFGYVPDPHLDKSLTFLRHEGGLDVYWNKLTGNKVFVGRASEERKKST